MFRTPVKLCVLLLFVGTGMGWSSATLMPDEAGCGPHNPGQPAGGDWHGSFWVEYEPSIEHAAVPITMRQRWQASLAFHVVRASEGGPRTDGEDGVIHGTADGEMKMEMKGNIRGQSFNQTAQGGSEVKFAIEGQERSPDFQFTKLELRRPPGQIGFNMTQTIKGGDSRATNTGNAGTGGYNQAHTSAESHGRSLEKNTSGNGGRTGGNDGKPKDVTWFVLSVEQRSCATMMGKIDRDALEARLKSSGMNGVVVDSNWAATYDNRDVQFEQQVDDLIRRVPNPPSIKVLKYLVDKYVELRGKPEQVSSYRSCVLEPLLEKLIQESLALMRQETERVQKTQVRFKDIAPLLTTVTQCLRFLQLMGAGECQLAKDIENAIQQKAREAVKWTVTHNPTPEEMLGIARQWELGALDLGNETAEFKQVYSKMGLGDLGR